MEKKNWKPLDSGINWPEGSIFPQMAEPAEQIDVIDISESDGNVQIAAISLQGIVNSRKPRILTIGVKKAEIWFSKFDFKLNRITLEEAVLKYSEEIKGAVIYDTEEPHTINLACTLSGTKGYIALDGKLADIFSKGPYDLKVREDYTGKFNNKFEVYRYMYDNVWPDCDKRLFAGITPDITNAYRDMGIAAKSLFIYLDPVIEEEAEVLSLFAKDCKPGETYYAGWWPKNEFGGLELYGKKYGICTIATDFFYNMSVYAGMSKEISMSKISDVPELENKIYVACMFSEGDNLQYDTNIMIDFWNEESRGTLPLTWSIAPALYDAAPAALNYFYKTATPNDCFITGPSGAAFVLSETWTDKNWIERFTKKTDRYCKLSGVRLGNVWNSLNGPMWDFYGRDCRFLWGVTEIRHEGEAELPMKSGNLIGITLKPGYAPFNKDYETIMAEVNEELKDFDGSKPKFIFAQGITWYTDIEDFIRFKNDIENKYGKENVVCVRGDHLTLLMQQYYKMPVNAAGGYLNRDVRITSSSGIKNIEKLNDGLYSSKEDLWTASGKGEQEIIFDLGREIPLSRFLIMNAGCANMDKALNTRSMTVQVSNDGKDWITVKDIENNEEDFIDFDIEEVNAQYVKFIITDGGEDKVVRISEIEIYGKF